MVWFSITHPDHRWLLPLLALVFLARLLMLKSSQGLYRQTGLLLAAAGAALCLASLWLRDRQWLMWYPVAVNVVMLTLFFGSLFSRMPFIERIARLREPELPARAIAYTRRVTQVWCLFFCLQRHDSVTDLSVGKHGVVDRLERHDQLLIDGVINGWRMAGTSAVEEVCLNAMADKQDDERK
ncbi:hypothetical protein DZS_02070 [Dickeya ananatis]